MLVSKSQLRKYLLDLIKESNGDFRTPTEIELKNIRRKDRYKNSSHIPNDIYNLGGTYLTIDMSKNLNVVEFIFDCMINQLTAFGDQFENICTDNSILSQQIIVDTKKTYRSIGDHVVNTNDFSANSPYADFAVGASSNNASDLFGPDDFDIKITNPNPYIESSAKNKTYEIILNPALISAKATLAYLGGSLKASGVQSSNITPGTLFQLIYSICEKIIFHTQKGQDSGLKNYYYKYGEFPDNLFVRFGYGYMGATLTTQPSKIPSEMLQSDPAEILENLKVFLKVRYFLSRPGSTIFKLTDMAAWTGNAKKKIDIGDAAYRLFIGQAEPYYKQVSEAIKDILAEHSQKIFYSKTASRLLKGATENVPDYLARVKDDFIAMINFIKNKIQRMLGTTSSMLDIQNEAALFPIVITDLNNRIIKISDSLTKVQRGQNYVLLHKALSPFKFSLLIQDEAQIRKKISSVDMVEELFALSNIGTTGLKQLRQGIVGVSPLTAQSVGNEYTYGIYLCKLSDIAGIKDSKLKNEHLKALLKASGIFTSNRSKLSQVMKYIDDLQSDKAQNKETMAAMAQLHNLAEASESGKLVIEKASNFVRDLQRQGKSDSEIAAALLALKSQFEQHIKIFFESALFTESLRMTYNLANDLNIFIKNVISTKFIKAQKSLEIIIMNFKDGKYKVTFSAKELNDLFISMSEEIGKDEHPVSTLKDLTGGDEVETTDKIETSDSVITFPRDVLKSQGFEGYVTAEALIYEKILKELLRYSK